MSCQINLHERSDGKWQDTKENPSQKYYGRFLYNNFHNEGLYIRMSPTDNNYMYEGSFYANNYEGYARVTCSNYTYFEGLFKNNRRFGPGVLTYDDGSQDVGLWDGFSLMRLSQIVMDEWVPSLARTPVGKTKLLKYRNAIPINNKTEITTDTIANNLNFPNKLPASRLCNKSIRERNSIFFDKKMYDLDYFGESDCMIEVALSTEDMLKELKRDESDVCRSESDEITYLDRLINCSPKELDLITFKTCILKMLARRASKTKRDSVKISTKKVEVDHLLAWNNSKSCVEFLKYTFLHRNRENIVKFSINKLLVGDRQSFENAGIYECACAAFLSACSKGNESEILVFSQEFHINPDLADARGNTGVVFAAARDRVGVIRILAQLGANLDMVNDEGLNPLTLCLLRYIATSRGRVNWEQSFLSNDDSDHNDKILTWCTRISFINLLSYSYIDSIAHTKSIFFKDDNKLMVYSLKAVEENTDLSALYEELSLVKPSESKQGFQGSYKSEVNGIETCILDVKLVKPDIKRAKVGRSKSKGKSKTTITKTKASSVQYSNTNKLVAVDVDVVAEVDNNVEDQLMVIFNTILILLYYGADANIGEVPMPAAMLALFADNDVLLKKLLDSGARIDVVTQGDNLTLLHVLVSLPPSKLLIKLCQVLIDYHIDLNARTSPNYWEAENKSIIGNYTSNKTQDIGKTALHILGMRYDFDLDPSGYLNDLAQLLVVNKASTKQTFLGHTPLSLAVLRGNNRLVKTLLKAGANANEELGESMGNVLTLYILKRYSSSLPNQIICEEIIDTILEFYGNPLAPVANNLNAIEFMTKEQLPQEVDKKTKNKNRHKKKKGGDNQIAICNYLTIAARNVAFRHYQCQALLYLMQSIMLNKFNRDELCLNLAKLLIPEDVLRVLQILINYNIFNVEDALQNILMQILVDFIQIHGFKLKDYNKNALQSPLDLIRILQQPYQKLKINYSKEFEVDGRDEIYKICFQCGLRDNKLLLACPKCGLVYFCSQQCNKLNNIIKMNRHPCRVLFYNDELAKYKACLAAGVEYIGGAAAMLAKVGNIRQALENLCKDMKTFCEDPKLHGKVLQKYAEDLKSRQEMYDSKHGKKSGRGSSSSGTSGKRRGKSGKRSGTSDTGSSSSGGRKGTRKGKRGRSTSTDSGGGKRGKSGSKGGKGGKGGKDGKDGARRKGGKSGTGGIGGTGRGGTGGIGGKLGGPGKDGQDAGTSGKAGTGADGDDQEGASNKHAVFPTKYQLFLQKIAELFPDFDLSGLMMPFVCFTNGEIYYRFYDDKPIYCPTYSNI